MKIINKKAEEFLFNYLNNFSPTGFESAGQRLWLDYLKPYVDEVDLDLYGTAYGIINPGQDYKVVIEGHADEISWYVNYITDDGYIYVVRNGGSDHMIAPAKRVMIHTKKGLVRGVFGWPAIHTRNSKDNNPVPAIDNIFLDVGASSKEEVLKMGVHVGCVVTFDDPLEKMNNKYLVGRALDNRLGGFIVAEVARLIKKNRKKIPYSLYIVNAVQEEVGLRGAEMVANTINPNVAIVTDVTHDTSTPLMFPKKQGDVKCGEGPSVTYGPSVHNTLRDLILDTAEKRKIPVQREAASRYTGTDTDAFAYSNGGVASALISIPLKYMHTTVETAHIDDIENVIRLIYESLLNIENGQDFRYFKP